MSDLNRPIEDLLAEMEAEKQVEKFRQGRLEKWFLKKNTLPFFNRRRDRVGLATLENGMVKVVNYYERGPLSDFTRPLKDIAHELKMEGYIPIVDFAAAIQLEKWSNTPEWDRGLKETRLLALWNAISRVSWTIASEIYNHQTIDEAIRFGNNAAKELGIEVY